MNKFIHKLQTKALLIPGLLLFLGIAKPLSAVTLLDSWTQTSTGLLNAFNPAHLSLDNNGYLLVAATDWGLIHTFTLNGVVVDTTITVSGVKHIVVDGAGNLYVSDFSSHHVLVYNSAGVLVATWGSQGSGDENFNRPCGIAIGPDGNIYVVDSNNRRIQVLSPTGDFIRRWGSFGQDPGEFTTAQDIAIDASGAVYVSENGAGLARIQKLTPYGTPIRAWGEPGYGPGEFLNLRGIALDAQANVYTTEISPSRLGQLQIFDSTGVYLGEFGGEGNGNYEFHGPSDVVVDNNGLIYVADYGNHRVQKFGSIATAINPQTPSLSARLDPPSPNPFGQQTTLRFNLAQESDAELVIYDVSGRKVATWHWSRLASGLHEVQWNGRADNGQTIGSGVLFCRLQTNGQVLTQKLVHLQ